MFGYIPYMTFILYTKTSQIRDSVTYTENGCLFGLDRTNYVVTKDGLTPEKQMNKK